MTDGAEGRNLQTVEPVEASVSNEDLERTGYGASRVAYMTSIRGEGRQLAAKLLKCRGNPTLTSDRFPPDGMDVVDWYVSPVQLSKGAGEITEPRPRVVLIGPDGQTAAFVSEGILRDLATVVRELGTDSFSPPLRVKLVRSKTRSGFTVLGLEIVL